MKNLFTHFCFINLCWCLLLLYGFTTGKLFYQSPQQNDFDALYETAAKPVKISKR